MSKSWLKIYGQIICCLFLFKTIRVSHFLSWWWPHIHKVDDRLSISACCNRRYVNDIYCKSQENQTNAGCLLYSVDHSNPRCIHSPPKLLKKKKKTLYSWIKGICKELYRIDEMKSFREESVSGGCWGVVDGSCVNRWMMLLLLERDWEGKKSGWLGCDVALLYKKREKIYLPLFFFCAIVYYH